MDVFTIDFETYYDKEYSLSRMSTEEYVTDPRFEIIMVGVKKNDEPTEIISCKAMEQYSTRLREMGVDRGAVLCHNTLFDGLILENRLGIMPPMLLDTLAMAQALLKPKQASISLAKCLDALKSPFSKGTTIHSMIGRRLSSLTESEFQEYAQYCRTDVDSEWWLFNALKDQLPKSEYLIIDMTLRMYLQPQFVLDGDVLTGVLNDEIERKEKLLAAVNRFVTPEELRSNPKFAKVLEKFGIEVPTKISPNTGKTTYAFSKSDPEWKALEEEYADDPLVSALLAARLGVKSTIGETRARRYLQIQQNVGRLRVPLRYYGAHTGRYAGMEKINCQNLPRVPRNVSSRHHLRYALCAPEGHQVLAADLSQIEARLNAWLSGCDPLLQVFRDRGDPYCAFATRVFNRTITKSDEDERFIGKTCILGLGYGMGHKKLQATLRKDDRKVDTTAALRYVQLYRETYPQIPDLWRKCDSLIPLMASGEAFSLIGPIMASASKLTLPNGMSVQYNNLRYVDTTKYKGWAFDFAGRPKTLWGGTMVENMIQSLARITVMEHMINIRKRLGLSPALQAHDELVYVVPEDRVEEYRDAVLDIMKTPPTFAPDLPIDAEADFGPTYGDAK